MYEHKMIMMSEKYILSYSTFAKEAIQHFCKKWYGCGPEGNALMKTDIGVLRRVLSVSGFPENTSMAVVVEAFEKRGKILVRFWL
jgi:hypothetical protein